MRIEVTAEDIKRGKRLDACRCPIAIAIRRQLGGMPAVDGRFVIADDARGNETHALLPDAARLFAHNFDAEMPVEPFAFDLPDFRRPASPL